MHPIDCSITTMGPCDRLRDGSKGIVFGGNRRDSDQLLVKKMEENKDVEQVSSRDTEFSPCSLTGSRDLRSSAWVRSHSTSHESLRKILRILSRSRCDEQISTGPQFVIGGTDGIQECPQKNLVMFLQSKGDEEISGISGQGNAKLWAEVGSADEARAEGLALRVVNCNGENANGMGSLACHEVDWKDCESKHVGSTSDSAELNVDYGLPQTAVMSQHDSESGVLGGGFESEERGGGCTHMATCQTSDEDGHVDCSPAQKEENCDDKEGRHGSLELLVDAISLASGTLFGSKDWGLAENGTASPRKLQGKRCISDGSQKGKRMPAGSPKVEKDVEDGPICERVKKTENYMSNWYADFEDFGPLVRSKRGRNQVLPSRFRDSVLAPWKRMTRPRLKR